MGARRRVFGLSVSVLAIVLTLLGGAVGTSWAAQIGEPGEGAEQVKEPTGVAVDTKGNVYVGDMLNNRIDKFDQAGNWLLAWGVGVHDGAGEVQTCTNICRQGSQIGSTEAFELPTGAAVDDDPLSSSYGDVYVLDEGHSRVEKFAPEETGGKTVMKFSLMIGGHVNETTGGDVCSVGEACSLYASVGSENGEFSYMPGYGFNSFIAVGSGGDVYVGDNARVEVFEPSGTWKENISLAALSTEARPTALAVDASGDVFVKDAGVSGVREFEANGTEKTVQFDAASESITAIAVDGDPASPAFGDVFVGDSNGGFHVLQFDASGKELANFGEKTVSGTNGGLAFSSVKDELYASDSSSIWAIPLPPAGPLVDGESATPELRGAATLEGQVDPEGSETTVRFEYVDDAHFKESGYASASSMPAVTLAAGFEDQTVSAHPTLVPGTTYHYRLVASNPQGTTTGEDQVFQETPPALIEGPWVTDVAATSATIEARIDPQGFNTTYTLEYGSNTAYGHTIDGSLGSGSSYLSISHHLQGLESASVYHYRIVTSNEVGTWSSPDRQFTTQAAGANTVLPDGREWELVSPAEKHGALIEPELLNEAFAGDVQAAKDGRGIAYEAGEPITEHPQANASYISQVLTLKGPNGWRSQEVAVPVKMSEEEDVEPAERALQTALPALFSSDLSLAILEPEQRRNQMVYMYESTGEKRIPLVTEANVPSGTEFMGSFKAHTQMRYRFATPDLSHVLIESPLALTKDALPAECSTEPVGCQRNLYEWNRGQLQLINVLPGGKPLRPHGSSAAGLGRFVDETHEDVAFSMSFDGRYVVWSQGPTQLGSRVTHTMYVRDMVKEETVSFGGPYARFDAISSDGSRILYWEDGDLYDFYVPSRTQTEITADHRLGEKHGGVVDQWWMGASQDGTDVYFVATGVLASGGVSGENNLYLAYQSGSSWSVRDIATLSKNDMRFCSDCSSSASPSPFIEFRYVDARVSPNGRYMAFMSGRSLTGYDNIDASSGQPDLEVYLYDAVSGRLACVSCNPSGARPQGVYDATALPGERPLVDRLGAWQGKWLAAKIPGWRESLGEVAQYQQRFLSNNGRLFFDSSDALASKDTNGLMDVYEYEPAGLGTCEPASASFDAHTGGCVSLISSGTSRAESGFMDASESGDDVFFATTSKLTSEDYDTSYDVYDAHVCSTQVPCVQPPVSSPACSSGDACKPAPTPQPEIFGPAPSATFSGTGNVTPETSSAHKVSPKMLSRAERRLRALRSCRKLRSRRKRLMCERHVRKRYTATHSHKTTSKGKG